MSEYNNAAERIPSSTLIVWIGESVLLFFLISRLADKKKDSPMANLTFGYFPVFVCSFFPQEFWFLVGIRVYISLMGKNLKDESIFFTIFMCYWLVVVIIIIQYPT